MERIPPPKPRRDVTGQKTIRGIVFPVNGMRCVKLLGQPLMARDFDRQVAEFQVRVAVLNGCTALGIPVTKVAGQVCPGEGAVRPSDDLCN